MTPELNKIYRHSEETKRKISIACIGRGLGKKRPEHSKWMTENFKSPMTGRKHSETTKNKMSVSHIGKEQDISWRKKRGLAISGEKHWNWKGGPKVPREVKRYIRKSLEYREWRKAVFSRDNYTCQKCGAVGVYLEAHHIKRFCDFPELRFEPSNGETLCRQCHLSTR